MRRLLSGSHSPLTLSSFVQHFVWTTILLLVTCVLLLLTGIAHADSSISDNADSVDVLQVTRTPRDTSTPRPTRTITPTRTPSPTRTITPTRTPTATRTPRPTSTDRPTKTPSPTRTPTRESVLVTVTDTPSPTMTPSPVLSTNTPTVVATIVCKSNCDTPEPPAIMTATLVSPTNTPTHSPSDMPKPRREPTATPYPLHSGDMLGAILRVNEGQDDVTLAIDANSPLCVNPATMRYYAGATVRVVNFQRVNTTQGVRLLDIDVTSDDGLCELSVSHDSMLWMPIPGDWTLYIGN